MLLLLSLFIPLISDFADVITVIEFLFVKVPNWLDPENRRKMEEAAKKAEERASQLKLSDSNAAEQLYEILRSVIHHHFSPTEASALEKDYELIYQVFGKIFSKLIQHRSNGTAPNYTILLAQTIELSIDRLDTLNCFGRWDSPYREKFPYREHKDFYVIDAPFTNLALSNANRLSKLTQKTAQFSKIARNTVIQRTFFIKWERNVVIEDTRENMKNKMPRQMLGVQQTEIIEKNILNKLFRQDQTVLGTTSFSHIGIYPQGQFLHITRAERKIISPKRFIGKYLYQGNPEPVFLDPNEFLLLFVGLVGDTILYSRAVRGEMQGISKILEFFQKPDYLPQSTPFLQQSSVINFTHLLNAKN